MASALYESIGRKQCKIEELETRYQSLLNLLGNIVSGEISTDRVLVDLTNATASWVPVGEKAALPPTINGSPVCIVAPAKPEPVQAAA